MFYLMCKDDIRATFELRRGVTVQVVDLNILGNLPIGCTEKNFRKWLDTRHASKHRAHLQKFLHQIGCRDLLGFLELTHGISINDCYWIKRETEDLLWKDVSPYINDFDEIIQRLSFDGRGLYGEKLSSTSPEFGTSGTFDKCWCREENGIYLYKRGSDIGSNSGLEPYCEVLASQVFSRMRVGIKYELVNFRSKVASKCKLFNNEYMSFVPYSALSSDFDFYDIIGFYESISNGTGFKRMLVCDAIVLNTDRHAGNHGVLVSNETNKIKSMAPSFDYNLAMLPYVTRSDFSNIAEQIVKHTPKTSDDFITAAKYCLTSSIRNDLLELRGITLSLPFTDDKFPQERVDWMTDIVNHQIDNVLYDRTPVYPTIKVDGLSNTYRYKLKYKLSDDEFVKEVPRLMKLFGISHMNELEERIADLL